MIHKTPKIFQGVLNNWKHDWNTNRKLFWLELIGTLGCVLAAGSLAAMAPHPNLIVVYLSYMVGSSTLTVSSYMRNNGWWVLLNLFFFTVDCIGLSKTLLG